VTPRAPLVLALGLVAIAGLSCGDEPEVEAEPLILASVGGRAVDFELFLLAARARTAPGEFPRTGAGFEEFRDRLLRDVLMEEVLLLEADRRQLAVSDLELEDAVREAGEGVHEEERLPELIADRFDSYESWQRVVERRLLTREVEGQIRAELAAGVEVTPEQVREATPRFADELRRPARLRARQVFAADAERIRAAQLELREGAPFDELAVRYNGADGDMGWMSVAEAPAVLVESTEGLAVGGVTEVVRSPLGYHLFQVLGREPAAVLADEAAAAEIERLLVAEGTERAWRDWLAGRDETLEATVHQDGLDQVRCCRLGLPYHGDAAAEEP